MTAAQLLMELHRLAHKPPQNVCFFRDWVASMQRLHARYKKALKREKVKYVKDYPQGQQSD